MCQSWVPPNHTHFHIANLFLALTYFCPNNLKGLIALRLCLGTAGLFFSLWAGLILCSPDTLGWNLVFAVINYVHVIYLWYVMRPIKFEKEHEVLYGAVFEQLGVARYQYKPLVDLSTVQEIPKGVVYASEHHTHGDVISIVTEGSVMVTKHGKTLHQTKPYEFLDSPEWILSTKGNFAAPITYEVTMISEGCTVITWKRCDLLRALSHEKQMKNIFNSIIGQDVAQKLFKSNRAWEENQNTEMANFMYQTSIKRGTMPHGIYNDAFSMTSQPDTFEGSVFPKRNNNFSERNISVTSQQDIEGSVFAGRNNNTSISKRNISLTSQPDNIEGSVFPGRNSNNYFPKRNISMTSDDIEGSVLPKRNISVTSQPDNIEGSVSPGRNSNYYFLKGNISMTSDNIEGSVFPGRNNNTFSVTSKQDIELG